MQDTNDDTIGVRNEWSRFGERTLESKVRGESNRVSRRNVLRAGAVVSGVVLGGSALAGNAVASQTYGNGNGLDVFLNEEAMFKESPIWDGEIANRMGQEVVDVAVGAMTSVSAPDPDAPPKFPMAFSPHVVKVSPGATVRWTWVSNPLDFPIPHDVTSLVDENGEPIVDGEMGENHHVEFDGEPRFHHHARYTPAESEDEDDINPTFEYNFQERGNHLYYCSPHGAPFPFEVEVDGEVMKVYNEVGMRGAVKVAGKPI